MDTKDNQRPAPSQSSSPRPDAAPSQPAQPQSQPRPPLRGIGGIKRMGK